MTPEKGKLRPTPPKAYLNPEFMGSPQARSIRVLTEMTEPHVRFKKHNVRNTVVMFGSARTLPESVARRQLEEAKALAASGACDGAECAHRLRVAEINLRSSAYYEACRELAFEMTKWSLQLPEWQRFLVCSGAGPGIMEAANRGAHEAGG
ncbi:MAG: lysine decarboxylase, partial [Verrucomicrobiota bacterium]